MPRVENDNYGIYVKPIVYVSYKNIKVTGLFLVSTFFDNFP